MRILWVEDEPKIVADVIPFLEQEGCTVSHVTDASQALNRLQTNTFDVLLIDWMLPGMDGVALCKEIRRKSDVAIIMLTAKSDEWHKVIALEIGADDYLIKPFGIRELLARMKAVLRRTMAGGQQEEDVLTRHSLVIHLSRHEVTKDGRLLALTPTEFDLLVTLARQPGRVFSRLQLMNDTFGESFGGFERTVDSHIRNLRNKIEDDPAQPQMVLTVYGVGYKLNQEGS
ncbi:response regulator [Paenibacillus sp. NPDC058071]|uniref:response regulator n=1 Tax=Paenibacillus sp. NPDC058071 TaxID=3346326 RepID=UPI0036DE9C53